MAAIAATVNTGQDCTAATRIYDSQNKLEAVQEAIVAAMRATRSVHRMTNVLKWVRSFRVSNGTG